MRWRRAWTWGVVALAAEASDVSTEISREASALLPTTAPADEPLATEPAASESTTQHFRIPSSPYDARTFEAYVLDNGVRAISVQQKELKQSAIAVIVYVGSAQDPPELQGLAHLVQRVVFAGAAELPAAGDYAGGSGGAAAESNGGSAAESNGGSAAENSGGSAENSGGSAESSGGGVEGGNGTGDGYKAECPFELYIQRNGGTTTAATNEYRTEFYATVANAVFEEAVQRLLNPFSAPVGSAAVEKEINALILEMMRHPNFDIRRNQTATSALLPFPRGHFPTGTSATLSTIPQLLDISILPAAQEFHGLHYCGLNMVVSTASPLSVEEQRTLVAKYTGKVLKDNDGACRARLFEPRIHPPVNPDLAAVHPHLTYLFPHLWNVTYANDPPDNWQNGFLHRLERITQAGAAEGIGYRHPGGLGPLIRRYRVQRNPRWTVRWSLRATAPLFKERPLDYVRYMFGYGGRHSLKEALTHQGWVRDLAVLTKEDHDPEMATLVLEVQPTEIGCTRQEEIMLYIMAYMNELRMTPVRSDVLDLIYRKDQIEHELEEAPVSPADSAAKYIEQLLTRSDFEDFHTVLRPDAEATQKALDKLTIKNAIIVFQEDERFTAAHPPGIVNTTGWYVDHGRIYSWDPFHNISIEHATYNETFVERLETVNFRSLSDCSSSLFRLQLAPLRKGVPEELIAFESSPPGATPMKLNATRDNVALWWRGAGHFKVPRARLSLRLAFHAKYRSLETKVAAAFVGDTVRAISRKAIDNFYFVERSMTGEDSHFSISVSGVHDKEALMEVTVLLGTAIRRTFSGTEESRFQRWKEQQLIKLNAVDDYTALNWIRHMARTIDSHTSDTPDGYAAVLRENPAFRSVLDVTAYLQPLKDVHVVGMTMGLSPGDTEELVNAFLTASGFRPTLRDSDTYQLAFLQTYGPLHSYAKANTHGAHLSYRLGAQPTLDDIAEASVLRRILDYTAFASTGAKRPQLERRAGSAHLYRLGLEIDKPTLTMQQQLRELRKSFSTIRDDIDEATDEVIAQWVEGARSNYNPSMQNAKQEFDRLWRTIDNGDFCWNGIQRISDVLNGPEWQLTTAKKTLLEAMDRALAPELEIVTLAGSHNFDEAMQCFGARRATYENLEEWKDEQDWELYEKGCLKRR